MKRILLTLLSTCCFTFLPAMEEIAFKHLGIKDGLSDSQISAITKDSQGFMWFSTSHGLNRYDGYTFKVFTRNSKEPCSLPKNAVGDVQEDAEGLLWIHTTRQGYVYFDPRKETFHSAVPFLEEKYGLLGTPSLLYIDKDKNFWTYEYNGVYHYNLQKQELKYYPMPEGFKEQNINLSCISAAN